MDVVRIGLFGCGRIAQLAHLRALARLPGAAVAAVADPDAARWREAGALAPQAAMFSDYRELLARVPVDAVVLALPPAFHADAAIAAFGAGKHVYVEKPIATTLADALEVVAAWRRSTRVGMIGFNYRFHPLYRAARDHLRRSRLGGVVAVRTTVSTAARALPEWKRARASGGGALMELASPHVDLVHFLFDEPVVEVAAFARSQHTEGDSAALHLRLEGGLLVQTFCSIAAVAEDRFEIYGRTGKLSIDRYAGTLSIGPAEHRGGPLARLQREAISLVRGVGRLLRASGEPSHGEALRAFVSAIRDGQPTSPDLEDGYRCLAIIDAAERSIATGAVVTPGAAMSVSARG